MNTDHAQAAANRLAHTRVQLQQALGVQPDVQPAVPSATLDATRSEAPLDAPGASSSTSSGASPGTSPSPARHAQGPRATSPTPAAQLLLATLRAWWARHPLHTAGTLALQTANAAARPVAQKHPVALLLGAAAVGAALVWAKPWRHVHARLLGTALLPALVPGLLSAFSPQSSRAVSSWLPQLLRALLAPPPSRAQPGAQTDAQTGVQKETSTGA